ncbi:MAG: glycerophosphodiester phosphodiesterase family protein [Pseudomonadota bacterium]
MRASACALVLMALVACEPMPSDVATSSEVAQSQPAHTLAPANLPAFFDCLRDKSQTIVTAHRGGHAPGFAENSVEAFAHTLSLTPAFLEVDVSATKDGQLVLMHDDTIDRTTDGHGAASDLTLAQFQALKLRDETGAVLDAHPPTLRQALDWADGKTVLELDIKRSVDFGDLIAAVDEAGAADRVIFVTYSDAAAATLHRRAAARHLNIMHATTISSVHDVDALEHDGIRTGDILAWTGDDEPNGALNIALAQRGVEASFGTGGGHRSWDARFAQEHREQYAAFADTGLQLISTDRPVEAAHDLDAYDNFEGYGPSQCVGAS